MELEVPRPLTQPSTWRSVLGQPLAYVGLAAIALLWLGVLLLIDMQRRASRAAIAQDTANLARVFEENVIRSVSEIDKTLLYLRQSWEKDRSGTQWSELIRQAFTASDITLQLAVIDAHGILLATDRALLAFGCTGAVH